MTDVEPRIDPAEASAADGGPPGPARRSDRLDRRRRAARAEIARVWASAVILTAVCLVAALYLPGQLVGAVLALLSIVVVLRKAIFGWTGLLMILLAVIMFLPVRRYKLPIPLPFALEPYRAVLVVVALGIIISLLVDPRFRWRRSGFGGAIGFFLATLTASLAVNTGELADQGLLNTSLGGLLNYVFLFGVFFIVRVLLRSEEIVQRVVMFLAAAGGIIGLGAVVERYLGFNVFMALGGWLQLQRMADPSELVRSGGARAFGSAQHPIALSVLFCMLLPLAIYLARHATKPMRTASGCRIFWLATAMAMLAGLICTVSRTSFVILGVMVVLGIMVRPRIFRPLVLIGLPLAAVAALAAPRVVLGIFREFLDTDELIASQYASAGWTGSGRLADLGPGIEEALRSPFFGIGVGSRIVVGPEANAFILDDQLLNTFIESGFLGLLGVVVLLAYPAVRLWRFSHSPTTPDRWTDLGAALSVILLGYLVALFFFDGFGFLQTVLVASIMLAIGGFLITEIPWTKRPSVATLIRARERAERTGKAPVSG
ncbi:hypothetical protein GIS00_18040 [Nakamurella sp. YIM 132087]|uniref:O-antigen ligase-related domain-containing protein n=1 Tax=Nakamurella alba TaxID=2665158 RepID=A0A7K1FR49_9ACTN|nr:O-antigen ligase family protein [Nakamurella alba]MTD15839.1 hypothetical protein [Nakamurella alba]